MVYGGVVEVVETTCKDGFHPTQWNDSASYDQQMSTSSISARRRPIVGAAAVTTGSQWSVFGSWRRPVDSLSYAAFKPQYRKWPLGQPGDLEWAD